MLISTLKNLFLMSFPFYVLLTDSFWHDNSKNKSFKSIVNNKIERNLDHAPSKTYPKQLILLFLGKITHSLQLIQTSI